MTTAPATVSRQNRRARHAAHNVRRVNIVRSAWSAYRATRRAGGRLVQVAAVLQIVSVLALVAQLLLGRDLLAHLTGAHLALHDLVWRAALLVVAFAVSGLSLQAVSGIQRVLAERVAAHAMGTVLEAAAQTDLIELDDSRMHDRIQRALLNAATRPTQMTLGLVSVMSSLITSLAVGATVLLLAPVLFVVAVLAAIPLTVLATRSSRAFFDFAVRQTAADRQRTYLQVLLVSRDWAKEVRAYRLGQPMLGRWQRLYEQRLSDLVSVVRSRFARQAAGVLGATLGLAITLYLVLWMVTTNRLSFAAAATAATAMLLLSRQLQVLANGVAGLFESALFIQDYQHFATQRNPVTDDQGTPATNPTFEAASLRDVRFVYPAGGHAALRGISIDVRAGEVVALVGENGSGKSTAAKVLAGLYRPTAGVALWNEVPYEQYPIDAIRDQIGVLFQDYVKFQMTVRENITLGRVERADVADADVRAAAVVAGADDVIERLPNGYDTELGPEFAGGTELSGGQWQRLALARAAFRGAPLVILDEPTAALDPIAEERLFASTRRIFTGKAVVLISHRFSSVRLADRIYVLADGKVVETGRHEELLAERGHYARMYHAQHEALLGPAGSVDSV